MLIPHATDEEVKAMTPEQYEAYSVMVIDGLANGFIETLNMLADSTVLPRVSVLAALIEVAAITIDDKEPQRSEDIAKFCEHFVARTTGTPKQ